MFGENRTLIERIRRPSPNHLATNTLVPPGGSAPRTPRSLTRSNSLFLLPPPSPHRLLYHLNTSPRPFSHLLHSPNSRTPCLPLPSSRPNPIPPSTLLFSPRYPASPPASQFPFPFSLPFAPRSRSLFLSPPSSPFPPQNHRNPPDLPSNPLPIHQPVPIRQNALPPAKTPHDRVFYSLESALSSIPQAPPSYPQSPPFYDMVVNPLPSRYRYRLGQNGSF